MSDSPLFDPPPNPPAWSACASPRRARLALAVLAASIAVGLTVALLPDPNPPFVPPPGATTDLDVFGRVIDGVRAGGNYYAVNQAELRAHGYPTRSVFNWRTPTLTWLCAAFPSNMVARVGLILAVLVLIPVTCRDMLHDSGLAPAAVAGVFFVGSTAWVFGAQTFLFPEVWAGVLIAASLGALRRGRVAAGVAIGVAALFVRELVLPYALACLALAWYDGRRREARLWAVGLLMYAAFMAFHASVVLGRITPVDVAMPEGWVRFGGVRFLLSTSQANVFLMTAPLWWTAIYLPLAVLGVTAWGGENARRVELTLALYLGGFSVVGAPFNFYWGFVFAPLLALGVAHTPRALGSLLSAAFPARATSFGFPTRPVVGG